MIELSIRPAVAADHPIIKQMVRRERLDPTSLKWQNFLIAEHAGQIVGIGQIKRYPGCNELGSLITNRRYRGKRVAARLIAALEDQAGFPLYLLCAGKMEPYYQRFGYQTIGWHAAPPFLMLKTFPALLLRLFGIQIRVMQKIGRDPAS